MKQMTLTQQNIDALCQNYGYRAEIDGKPNPENKEDFAFRKIGQWIAIVTKDITINNAVETARGIAIEQADALILPTIT